VLVQGVIDGLRRFGEVNIEFLAGTPEDVKFKLPAEVADV
jgi:4-hydroxy-3-methylbut-2-enyl diphosphate reductase